MKNRNIALLLLAIAGAAASCSKTEIMPDKGTGSITLGVSLSKTKAALSSDELQHCKSENLYGGLQRTCP